MGNEITGALEGTHDNLQIDYTLLNSQWKQPELAQEQEQAIGCFGMHAN